MASTSLGGGAATASAAQKQDRTRTPAMQTARTLSILPSYVAHAVMRGQSRIRPICADSDGQRSPRANQASDVLPEQHARESLKTQGPSFTPACQGAFNPAQARNPKASPERVCFLGGLGGAWRLLKNSCEYPFKIKHFPPGVLSQKRPVPRTGPPA